MDASVSVRFVVTEHPPALTAEAAQRYERARRRLEAVAGEAVELVPYTAPAPLEEASAVVLGGSWAPWSAHSGAALEQFGEAIRSYEGPVLGLCAGMQLQARFAGGVIAPMGEGDMAERGYLAVEILDDRGLLAGIGRSAAMFHDHTDEVAQVPPGFRVLARTSACAVQAIADDERRWWGTQFHAEEFDDAHPAGEQVLRNFFALARV
jgi:GMP synthase (glutamine-hydrolysing)